jgi:hypothetical protein
MSTNNSKADLHIFPKRFTDLRSDILKLEPNCPADLLDGALRRVEARRLNAEHLLRAFLAAYWAGPITRRTFGSERPSDLLDAFRQYAEGVFISVAEECIPLLTTPNVYEQFVKTISAERLVRQIFPGDTTRHLNRSTPIIGFKETLSEFEQRLPDGPDYYITGFVKPEGDWELLLEDTYVHAIRTDELGLDFVWGGDKPFFWALREPHNLDFVDEHIRVALERHIPNLMANWWQRISQSEAVPPGASRCGKLSTKAQSRYPNIDRFRKECGWSFDQLAAVTELDKKLILGHVNHGKRAHPSTLKAYADAFSEKMGRAVTVEELSDR